jgi:hypothetical protein
MGVWSEVLVGEERVNEGDGEERIRLMGVLANR